MKTCPKCKAEKPETDFCKDPRKKDGLESHCKDCRRAYRNANKERIAANRRAYHIANRDAISKKLLAWRIANPEKHAENVRAFRKANPGKSAEYNRNRRARILKAEGVHDDSDVKLIFDKQRGMCASCGARLSVEGNNKFHIDHIVPLALGGSNWPDNLQCLCRRCNLSKGFSDPVEWANRNGKLI